MACFFQFLNTDVHTICMRNLKHVAVREKEEDSRRSARLLIVGTDWAEG